MPWTRPHPPPPADRRRRCTRAQLPGAAAAPPERTLVDILTDTAGHFPDASALDDGRRSLSYAQLVAAAKG
jgi:non-ribosomal peptide synthetase component F